MKKLAILDTETTDLDERTGDMWELGLILRDLRQPAPSDLKFWWQIRPNLRLADPNSVRIGRYYERSRVMTLSPGKGKRLATSTDQPAGGCWIHAYTGESPAEGDYYMVQDAADIAAQLAKHLDGATIVANNPTHDRKFLAKFLRANGQILTAHHRMLNIRDLLIGYIDGRLALMDGDVSEAFGPEVVPHVMDWLDGAVESPAWEIVGVKQDPATKHTALGDARLVRDVYDAIRGVR
jgi:hypothetical protein